MERERIHAMSRRGGSSPIRGERSTRYSSACVHCKARRVKCDRLLPCINCIKRSQRCQYPRVRGIDDYGSSYPGNVDQPMQWSRDMFLMHHYSTHTAPVFIVADPMMKRMWTKDIPPLALEHPALWSGLLSLSALHLAFTKPEQEKKWLKSALSHQNNALRSFRMSLTDLNGQSIHATMALSLILAVWSMAYSWSGSTHAVSRQKSTGDFIEPLIHINGIFKMLTIGRNTLHAGPLRPFAPATPSSFMLIDDTVELRQPVHEALQRLRMAIMSMVVDEETRDSLIKALYVLRRVYWLTDITNDLATHERLGNVWRFAAFVDQEYLALLRGVNEPAMVILAYFVVLTAGYDQQWYLSGYAAAAIETIRDTVSKEWRRLLDWPTAQLNPETAVLAHSKMG